jgi:Fe-S-cluster containining protein
MSKKNNTNIKAELIRGGLHIREQISAVWNASVAREFRAVVRDMGRDVERRDAIEQRLRDVAGAVLGVCKLVEDMQTAGFRDHGIVPKCPKDGGCFACCCEMVEVAPVEAAVAAWGVMCLDEERDGVIRRLAEWNATFSEVLRSNGGAPPLPTEYIKKHLRCPFLSDDDRCTIYELRPSVCRTYVSEQGRITCHEAFGEDKMEELMLPSVPEAGAIAAIALSVDGFTVVFQQAVAWFLGAAPAPVSVHDMEQLIDDLRAVADNQGETDEAKSDADDGSGHQGRQG